MWRRATAIESGLFKMMAIGLGKFAGAQKYGVKAEGNSVANTVQVLGELVDLMAAGRLEIPIAKTYPLAEVQEAYRDLEQRHTQGKIVLKP